MNERQSPSMGTVIGAVTSANKKAFHGGHDPGGVSSIPLESKIAGFPSN